VNIPKGSILGGASANSICNQIVPPDLGLSTCASCPDGHTCPRIISSASTEFSYSVLHTNGNPVGYIGGGGIGFPRGFTGTTPIPPGGAAPTPPEAWESVLLQCEANGSATVGCLGCDVSASDAAAIQAALDSSGLGNVHVFINIGPVEVGGDPWTPNYDDPWWWIDLPSYWDFPWFYEMNLSVGRTAISPVTTHDGTIVNTMPNQGNSRR
jgi:hypothetical protein